MTTRTHTRTIARPITARRFDGLAALVMLIAGAAGCYYIVTRISPIAGSTVGGLPFVAYAQAFFNSPNVGGVLLLLAALTIGTLGGAWLVIRLLHWRFRPTFEPVKVWRQALWVALFVAIGAWLQLSRALTVVLAALIASGFVMIEVFLNVRERQE
ncbi:MAG TPA: hypothetical protein VIK33_07975 [Anaerolineae bacterium]